MRINEMMNAIEIIGLTKYYPGKVIGVENLSLSVAEGEIYGFLGSNGAGKTTTIRMLINLLFPSGGCAKIFGKDAVKQHLDICKEIGYLPSSVQPHKHMTGESFLEYMGRLAGDGDRQYRHYLLDRFEFSQKDLQRKVKTYSSGMARKIGLVQAFQHRPKLLIMDEPTEGLDPVMQHTFYELLKEYRDKGGTVFISSHHLLEVEQVCDRAAIIRKGKLVATEQIHDLMANMTRSIEVNFKKEVSLTKLACKDWEIIANPSTDQPLKAKITGDMDAIIKLLGGFEIKDIYLPKPNLQDVFLDYYKNGETGNDR
jgi:beta-exotoxin I transport system ATP-binding protein